MRDIPFSDECARRVKEGDADAIAEVYSVMSNRLLGYIISKVRNRSSAEDILEQVFIKLIRKGHNIEGDAISMKVWLFRVAYTTSLDYLRKVSRQNEDMSVELGDLNLTSDEESPDDVVVRRETQAIVRAAMVHLSDDQRAVLELRYLGGLSSAEVAATLNKTEGAVRSLQHRGEKALHRMLADTPISEFFDRKN